MNIIESKSFFKQLWKVYSDLNPQVAKVRALFEQRGEVIVNDHIAFRTFAHKSAHESLGISAVSAQFEKMGYQPAGDYIFPKKHLVAQHFESAEPGWPKIFVSELDVSALSPLVQSVLTEMLGEFDLDSVNDPLFCCSGRSWSAPSYQTYELLRRESEYAAWMAVFGHVPNHFTVRVNELTQFKDLEQVNDFVEQAGYQLNDAGGKIKGSPDVYLEQSSTLADLIAVNLRDGTYQLPSVFYEFALRYPVNDQIFEGFITDNAEKIFESTDRKG